MAMSLILAAMIAVSCLYSFICGGADLSSAVFEGAGAAVQLVISICGATCLWSGVAEVMKQSGLSAMLARFMHPVISLLFPTAGRSREALEALSANISANMLGLGNAATPLGIKAASLIYSSGHSSAMDEMCLLVVLNTASIQLIPSTVAAVRAQAGASAPMDILPAVWITSAASVAAGLAAAAFFRRIWK